MLGTQALCEAARRSGVERFHHISTCEVYGDLALDSEESFIEDSPVPAPDALQRLEGRLPTTSSRSYAETFDLPATITNCCNNYGPYQFPEKVIPLFTTRALDGEPLPLYASTENRREWLHVDRPLPRRSSRSSSGAARARPTTSAPARRRASSEIADVILDATGQPASLKTIVPDRPGHDRRYLLDSTKIRTELGWEPVDLVRARASPRPSPGTRTHQAWWGPLIGRSPVVEDAWVTTAAGDLRHDVRFRALGAARRPLPPRQLAPRLSPALRPAALHRLVRRRARPSPAQTAKSAQRSSPSSSAGQRSGGAGRSGRSPRPAEERSTCSTREVVLAAVVGFEPMSSSTPQPSPTSTPASQSRSERSPSTRSAPATSPKPRGSSRHTSATCPTDYVFDGHS